MSDVIITALITTITAFGVFCLLGSHILKRVEKEHKAECNRCLMASIKRINYKDINEVV